MAEISTYIFVLPCYFVTFGRLFAHYRLNTSFLYGLFFLQGVDQHTAGGEDIFATRTTDSGSDAMLGQIVAQPDHRIFIGGREIAVNTGMKTYKIDAARQPLQQAQQLLRMARRIVLAGPTDILETDTALVGPVVLLEQRNEVGYMNHFLRRHDSSSLRSEWIVQ